MSGGWPFLERHGIEVVPHQEKIEAAIALVAETIDVLLCCPPDRVEASADEAFHQLKPHMDEALKALAAINHLRDLTAEERAQWTAFERFCHDYSVHYND